MTPGRHLPELEQAIMARNGKRTGDEIAFCCAAHEDKNPSASYSTSKNAWYCHACGASGDYVDLSERLGVSLPADTAPGAPDGVPGTWSGAHFVRAWAYLDQDGHELGYVARYEGEAGKSVIPFFERNGAEWKPKGAAPPRPLYGLDRLHTRPEAPVVVVEGEKAADAAERLYPGVVAITSPGGSKAALKADWGPLAGRRVLLWPDNDEPGRRYVLDVLKQLEGLDVDVSGVVDVEALGLPASGDAADLDKDSKPAKLPLVTVEEYRPHIGGPSSAMGGASPAEHHQQAGCEAVLLELERLSGKPDLATVETLLRALGSSQNGEDGLSREFIRERATKALEKKVKAPGRLVDRALLEGAPKRDEGQGKRLSFESHEPWPEAVDGAVLLEDIAAAFRRYVALPPRADTALALWSIFAHAFDNFHIGPMLALNSPTKRCGKSTALNLVGKLVPSPLTSSNLTPAVLFRAVEKYKPTLLLDEAETYVRRDREELRGVLNASHVREQAFVLRTSGDDHEPRCFSTWCPKAFAYIGRLPDTLEDRAVKIPMHRKAPEEKLERFRSDRTDPLRDLHRRAARWATDHAAALRDLDPAMPPKLNDRAQDNWRPLVAIADIAGGDWPTQARGAALQMSGADEDDEGSVRERLLRDIHQVFKDRGDRVFSEDLAEELGKMEDRPWAEWGRANKAITKAALAKQLKPFGIKPRSVRIGPENKKGYDRRHFEETFSRYLPPSLNVTPSQVNNDGGLQCFPNRHNEADVTPCETPETPVSTGVVTGVTVRERGGAQEPRKRRTF